MNAVAVSLFSTLAGGCLEEESPAAARLGRFMFANQTEQPRTVEVVVERGGEVVFREERSVPPTERRSTDVAESLPDEPGAYEITVTDRATGDVSQVEVAEESCVSIIYKLTQRGVSAYGPADDPDDCQ